MGMPNTRVHSLLHTALLFSLSACINTHVILGWHKAASCSLKVTSPCMLHNYMDGADISHCMN